MDNDMLDWLDAIKQEYLIASHKFPPFRSPHEGLAIIQEEFEELKEVVFKHDVKHEAMRREAVQLGAMALRFLIDCKGGE